MYGARLVIAVLTVTLITQLAASSPIESAQSDLSNLLHGVECHHGPTTVHCDLKDWPNRQVRLTAASFPRNINAVTVGNIKELVIEAGAIASLASLKVINLYNIDELTLLPRSFARKGTTGPTELSIHNVTKLSVHQETFAGWRTLQSKVFINDVGNVHMLDMALSYTHLRTLSIQRVANLDIGHGAFRGSFLNEILLAEVKSLSLSTGAFITNTTVKTMTMTDIDALTLHSGAFAHGTKVEKLFITGVHNLLVAPGGIKSEIDILILRRVAMETCNGNTFEGTINSLSLIASRINMTQTNCISASKKWAEFHVDASHIGQIKPLSFHGSIERVHIKNSALGNIRRGGFSLNVANFSIEESTFDEVCDRALEIHATGQLELKKCFINTFQRYAFSMLDLKEGAEEKIRIEDLKIKTPETGSLEFDHGQNFLVLRLEVGIPCTCPLQDRSTALSLADIEPGTDAFFKTLWLFHVRCDNNGKVTSLGEYQLEHCALPTTTTVPTTTSTPTTSIPTTTSMETPRESGSILPPQSSAGDSPEQGPQRASHTMHQHGDSPDQVQTGSSNNLILILITVCAVLIVLVVIALFTRRHFGHLPRHPSTPGRNFWQRIFTRDQQTSGSSQPLTISAPILGVTGPACSTPHQSSVQSVTDSQASTEPTESRTSRGTDPGTDSPGTHLLPLEAQGGAHGGSWQEPRYYVDIPVDIRPPSQRLVRPRSARTHRSGGGARESSRARSERRDWESYQMNRQKDPRIQQLARDPRWARGEILLDPEF